MPPWWANVRFLLMIVESNYRWKFISFNTMVYCTCCGFLHFLSVFEQAVLVGLLVSLTTCLLHLCPAASGHGTQLGPVQCQRVYEPVNICHPVPAAAAAAAAAGSEEDRHFHTCWVVVMASSVTAVFLVILTKFQLSCFSFHLLALIISYAFLRFWGARRCRVLYRMV